MATAWVTLKYKIEVFSAPVRPNDKTTAKIQKSIQRLLDAGYKIHTISTVARQKDQPPLLIYHLIQQVDQESEL